MTHSPPKIDVQGLIERVEPLTIEDSKTWSMVEAKHYNGGEAFFAYLHRCVQQPRLSRFDRYDRKTRGVTSTWRTDGMDYPDLASAIDALNTPPVWTESELVFLRGAPADWTKKVAGSIDWETNECVVSKGGVEWNKGHWRLTEAGRKALQAQGETE